MKYYWAYRLSARRADLLITVSESSKRDMVECYGLKPDKIHVLSEGVDTRIFRPIRDEVTLREFRIRHLGADRPFCLLVGKPNRRHNTVAVLQAFSQFVRESSRDHLMLFIGTGLPGLCVEDLARAAGMEDRLRIISHAEHDMIALATNAADVVLYPSSYEGFGMPVLEAMACGRPVIALNNTAFPEFAGGIAYLAEDARPETLSRAITEIVNDASMRRRMEEEGPKRAAGYDWRIIAPRTMDLLKTLL